MNSRAAYNLGRKTIYFIIVIFVVSFMFLYLRNAITSYNDDVVRDYGQIESGIIVAEALTSPKCFAYYDDKAERVYPGKIDYEKFNQEKLDGNCMMYIENSFRLRLLNKTLERGEEKEWETIVSPVLVFKDGKMHSEKLYVDVEDYYSSRGQKGPRGDRSYYKLY